MCQLLTTTQMCQLITTHMCQLLIITLMCQLSITTHMYQWSTTTHVPIIDHNTYVPIIDHNTYVQIIDYNTNVSIINHSTFVPVIDNNTYARWRTHWVITKRNDLPTTLCTTLDSVNPDRTILHLFKKKIIPDPLPLSRIMASTLLSLSYAPGYKIQLLFYASITCRTSMKRTWTLIDKNFLKLFKICPSCLNKYEHLHCFVQVHFKISMNMHQSKEI
jgi:hypothetical protein